MRLKYSSNSVYRPFAIIKKYGNEKVKIVYIKSLRQKGYEKIEKKQSRSYDLKLANSISRTRAKIFEYSMCNSFEYFVTLTINPEKYDRSNLTLYYKDFSQFLRNYKRIHGYNIDYLFIPELHKDGKSWHMHGFIKGIPETEFTVNSNGYLDWKAYSDRFGYISLDKIRNPHACSMYITKYISKNLTDCIQEKGAKMYYCSKGLKTAVELDRFEVAGINLAPTYFNDFCKIYWTDTTVLNEYLKIIKKGSV